jgi:hypothetical protein
MTPAQLDVLAQVHARVNNPDGTQSGVTSSLSAFATGG